ncbi:hypothetical protein [Desulfolutivibrio sulfoxidireducens]|uniref:hypothetical protein n=1 Tax=Desulfolutivibrio sulfoxidireducens TaxID=2773299 RepID=UPI00159D5CA7|nr:hypothetical protein [Desulfolutivibrio sulfoxidireducens]
MRRFMLVSLVIVVAFASACSSKSQTSFLEVRMTGDARVSGQFFSNRNFTGWK